jgi:hypothetical protein
LKIAGVNEPASLTGLSGQNRQAAQPEIISCPRRHPARSPDATPTIELPDDNRMVRRATTQPVRSIKAARPRKAGHVS